MVRKGIRRRHFHLEGQSLFIRDAPHQQSVPLGADQDCQAGGAEDAVGPGVQLGDVTQIFLDEFDIFLCQRHRSLPLIPGL